MILTNKGCVRNLLTRTDVDVSTRKGFFRTRKTAVDEQRREAQAGFLKKKKKVMQMQNAIAQSSSQLY